MSRIKISFLFLTVSTILFAQGGENGDNNNEYEKRVIVLVKGLVGIHRPCVADTKGKTGTDSFILLFPKTENPVRSHHISTKLIYNEKKDQNGNTIEDRKEITIDIFGESIKFESKKYGSNSAPPPNNSECPEYLHYYNSNLYLRKASAFVKNGSQLKLPNEIFEDETWKQYLKAKIEFTETDFHTYLNLTGNKNNYNSFFLMCKNKISKTGPHFIAEGAIFVFMLKKMPIPFDYLDVPDTILINHHPESNNSNGKMSEKEMHENSLFDLLQRDGKRCNQSDRYYAHREKTDCPGPIISENPNPLDETFFLDEFALEFLIPDNKLACPLYELP